MRHDEAFGAARGRPGESVEEQVNGHNQLIYQKKRTPKIIADRDFLGRKLWRSDGQAGFVLVTNFEERDSRLITDANPARKVPEPHEEGV